MTRWSPDAALRLEEAALALFEEAGFSATTVPQIAERAGLTTRTFFRHFSDKRDVLFLRDREFPDVISRVLDAMPDDLPAGELIMRGLLNAAEELDTLREPIARRRRVIRSEAHLRERELLKLDRLADAVSAALRSRRIAPEQAVLLSRLAALVFDSSLDRWLGDRDTESLPAVLTKTWAELQQAL